MSFGFLDKKEERVGKVEIKGQFYDMVEKLCRAHPNKYFNGQHLIHVGIYELYQKHLAEEEKKNAIERASKPSTTPLADASFENPWRLNL